MSSLPVWPVVFCALRVSVLLLPVYVDGVSRGSVSIAYTMVLRRLFFSLINNHQVIEKLADSRPIRRAAQLTVFALTQAQLRGSDAAKRLLQSETVRQIRAEAPKDLQEASKRVGRIRETFMREVKEGMQEAKGNLKGKQQK